MAQREHTESYKSHKATFPCRGARRMESGEVWPQKNAKNDRRKRPPRRKATERWQNHEGKIIFAIRVLALLVEAVWRLLRWQSGWKAAQRMKVKLASANKDRIPTMGHCKCDSVNLARLISPNPVFRSRNRKTTAAVIVTKNAIARTRLMPNDTDHRPSATGVRHETEAPSPGSVHPFLLGRGVISEQTSGR